MALASLLALGALLGAQAPQGPAELSAAAGITSATQLFVTPVTPPAVAWGFGSTLSVRGLSGNAALEGRATACLGVATATPEGFVSFPFGTWAGNLGQLAVVASLREPVGNDRDELLLSVGPWAAMAFDPFSDAVAPFNHTLLGVQGGVAWFTYLGDIPVELRADVPIALAFGLPHVSLLTSVELRFDLWRRSGGDARRAPPPDAGAG